MLDVAEFTKTLECSLISGTLLGIARVCEASIAGPDQQVGALVDVENVELSGWTCACQQILLFEG